MSRYIGVKCKSWRSSYVLSSGTDATAAMLDEMLSSVNYDNRVRPFANQGEDLN